MADCLNKCGCNPDCSCDNVCDCDTYLTDKEVCDCDFICTCNVLCDCDDDCTCQTKCNTQCAPDCDSVCSKNCYTVGTVVNGYGTPDVASGGQASVTIFNKLMAVVDAFRAKFGYAATGLTVIAGDKVLATDWNTKIRDSVYNAVYRTGVTATVGSGVDTRLDLGNVTADVSKLTDKTPNAAITSMNTRYCSTVRFGYCYNVDTCDSVCTCDGECSCNSQCSCDTNYCDCNDQCTCQGFA